MAIESKKQPKLELNSEQAKFIPKPSVAVGFSTKDPISTLSPPHSLLLPPTHPSLSSGIQCEIDYHSTLDIPSPICHSPIRRSSTVRRTYLYAKNPYFLRFDYLCSVNTPIDLVSLESLKTNLIFWINSNQQRSVRRHANKYSLTLDSMLANLWVAYSCRKQLVVGAGRLTDKDNNPSRISYKMKAKVLEFLQEKEFIKIYRGKPNEYDKLATWCGATTRLIRWFELDSVRAKLAENAVFLELRKLEEHKVTYTKSKYIGSGTYESVQATKTIKKWVAEPIPDSYKAKARKLALPARQHNEVWINCLATLYGDYVEPYLCRIFNGKLYLGGRLCGAYQNMPKGDRPHILIDDMPTTEPDFKGLHMNLLYTEAGIQWPLVKDVNDVKYHEDVYAVKGYDREVIKRVCLPLMYTTSLRGLEAQITSSGKAKRKSDYQKYKLRMESYNKAKAKGAAWSKPESTFEGFIEGIPDGTDGKELIAALMKKHEPIAHRFGEAELSLKLQFKDSQIMSSIITKLAKRHIPVLPVHDSVRCKVSDAGIVYATMLEAYEAATDYKISVHF
jgi:hypothetical protein